MYTIILSFKVMKGKALLEKKNISRKNELI